VNNAKAENGSGNDDGNGSFAVVRITDTRLDVATCRWLDDHGRYEWVAPFDSGPIQEPHGQGLIDRGSVITDSGCPSSGSCSSVSSWARSRAS
jgi:hypothetical protein